MNNLIASYCQYPGDKSFLSSIYGFLFNILSKIIDPHFVEKTNLINETIVPDILKTIISFIDSPEASKIAAEEQDFQKYFDLLDKQNEDIVTMCLIFFNKLIDILNFNLQIDFDRILKLLVRNIVIEKTGTNGVDNEKNFEEIEKGETGNKQDVMRIVNEKIVWHVIRLISNSIVLKPDLCEKIYSYLSLDDNSQKNLIFKLYEIGISGKLQIEIVFLLTNLVRLGSNSLLENICKESDLITIFVDSFDLEDPDLIDAILCALAKIMQSELSESRQNDIKDKFNMANGEEAINKLIENNNESISQQALVFRNKIIEQPEPYKFNLDGI